MIEIEPDLEVFNRLDENSKSLSSFYTGAKDERSDSIGKRKSTSNYTSMTFNPANEEASTNNTGSFSGLLGRRKSILTYNNNNRDTTVSPLGEDKVNLISEPVNYNIPKRGIERSNTTLGLSNPTREEDSLQGVYVPTLNKTTSRVRNN